MNDLSVYAEICLMLALVALSSALGIMGIVCCIAQCVRHCKQIWKG